MYIPAGLVQVQAVLGNLNTEALDDESGDDAYGGDDDYLDIEEVEESEGLFF